MKKTIVSLFFLCLMPFLGHTVLGTGSETNTINVFSQRRAKLMEKMGGGVAIFTPQVWDGNDFYYLTGFDEPEAVCLLMPGAKEEFVLFVEPENPSRTLWTGKKHGLEAAKKIFGADAAFPLDQLEKLLPRYLRGKDRIFFSPREQELHDMLEPWLGNPTSDFPKTITDPTPYIHAMRLIKDSMEVQNLQEAISITCAALSEVMKAAAPGMYEYELEAVLEYVFHRKGSPRPGFPSIVGSGPNTTILHYESNRRQIRDGELILMDVGAEFGGYKADVTRTFPANGTFAAEQRLIYEIVLHANEQAISIIRPGAGLYEVHLQALEIIQQGLFQLGLITDKDSAWQTQVWLMYNTNHWIGLDVHDVGGRGPRDGIGMKLQPGMVMTVEPGIYVGPYSLAVLEDRMQRVSPSRQKEMQDFINTVKPVVAKFMNLGVRIEDDVLVTKNGCSVLSKSSPKQIQEIEQLMRQQSHFDH